MFGLLTPVVLRFSVRKAVFSFMVSVINNYNTSEIVEWIGSSVPIVLDWVIAPNRSSDKATECKKNSDCFDIDGGGYRCRCKIGFEGNPYLDRDCQGKVLRRVKRTFQLLFWNEKSLRINCSYVC